ncbi:MAG: efflux RND transporter permease subunit [Bacteroidales bacterium]|nr:efflux RND transporter permease subunit [Bacteroidales bacterium]MCL2132760.1 efflux RND transporter permease subunit [Bacteroidales bacterium]
MKIYETSVRKPISTILIFIGAIILGLFSLDRLSVDLYPEMDFPAMSVITSYAGAAAADIEQNVTKRLEDNLNTVSNLKKITSRSQDNMSIITLEFEWGSNLDEASNDVRDVIGRVESFLPDNVDKPMIIKFNSSMIPIMFLYATANESYNGLYKILDEKVANPINRINGVGAVSINGSPTREVQVNVDPKKLEAYRLTVEQIGQIIAQENANIPAGAIDIGSERLALRIEGEFAESDLLKNTVVSRVSDKIVLLSDIATVKDTIKTMTVEETINGEKGVRIIIQKQSGANSVEIAKAIQKLLPSLRSTLPPDITLEVLVDTSQYITNSINSLTETVMYAFIFVVLVVLFFLGRWRATFIIALTIPVSLMASFVYLLFMGGSLNIISLSSLSIAIGMVVDDAIVVLENIVKHLERGARPKDAAIYATNEVWLAVIATTLTVIAVFLPLTMTGGIAGIMFKPLGWIVSIVIMVSTIAAITLTPMLSSKLLQFQAAHTYKGLGVIFKPIDKFLDKLDDAYAVLLTWAVRHRSVTLITAFLVFLSSLTLLTQVPTEMFSMSDNGQISATVELPIGTNLEQTKGVAHRLGKTFRELCPEIIALSISAGADDRGGFAALMGNSGVNAITFTGAMESFNTRKRKGQRGMEAIAEVMRAEIAKLPEVTKYAVMPGGGRGGSMMSSGLEVKVFGYDFKDSEKAAKALADSMRTIPGLRDVTLSREEMRVELQVDFDREKLARFGLNTVSAAMFVSNRINGLTASKFREHGEEYDIVVRYDEAFRTSIEDIENIVLYNSLGDPDPIRLREVAKIVERFSPPKIEHENRQRVITVSAGLSEVALGTVAEATQTKINTMDIPDGIDIVLAGSVQDQKDSFADLLTLLVLIVILVYIVMATQFESFLSPFIIMLSVPFAFTGVFLALWLTGTPLGMIALIGAIMLVGIVVKNGIVIVDFTNLQRERGLSINQAVITAGKSRLRPVLMTSITTILGMLPLAIGGGEGSELWKPMGIAVVGGLVFSTLLTLLVVPATYSVFGRRQLKRERKDNRIEV